MVEARRLGSPLESSSKGTSSRRSRAWCSLIAIALLIVFAVEPVASQVGAGDGWHLGEFVYKKRRAMVLAVPTTAALTLLGDGPAKVTRPAFSRNFNINVLLRERGMTPNFGVSFKPIHMIFLHDISETEYYGMRYPELTISTLDLSMAATQTDDVKRVSLTFSFTPYCTDPLKDPVYQDMIDYVEDSSRIRVRAIQALEDSVHVLQKKIDDRNQGIRSTLDQIDEQIRMERVRWSELLESTSPRANEQMREIRANLDYWKAKRDSIQWGLGTEEEGMPLEWHVLVRSLKGLVDARYLEEKKRLEREIDSANGVYLNEEWNTSTVDIGYGKVYEYYNPEFETTHHRREGHGFWLNWAWGPDIRFRHRVLISGIVRYTEYGREENWLAGVNVRVGGPRLNTFLEFTSRQTFSNFGKTISYGGEYRFDLHRSIEFSLNADFTSAYELHRLYPKMKFNWNFDGGFF